jgi:hypothetical protein
MVNRLAFAILRHCYSDISALGNNLVKSQIHALYETITPLRILPTDGTNIRSSRNAYNNFSDLAVH